MARDWLDSQGRLRFGKYKGRLVEVAAREDPGYLRWALENAEDMADEDREIIEAHLSREGKL